ncbi:MAG: glycine cleavage system aminomethyltransferase GcvT [Phycisphaerae bacterium]|nr:glycine cleavage system aminomethyltransferase GcvT [Phycisphaerae bacterium]
MFPSGPRGVRPGRYHRDRRGRWGTCRGSTERAAVLRTPLYQSHVEWGGKMVDFAGWEMPILYQRPGGGGGIHDEHHQVRTSGGVFDVSHMGRVKVSGRHARRFLERLCTRKISDMQGGQCRYSLVCHERGGILDDVIVYRMDEDEFLVVVNASNRAKLLAHFERVRAAGELVVKIDDQTESTAMVALQGPKVMELIGKVSREVPTLKRYRFTVKNLLILKLVVSRTGYTGEDGVEVILPAASVGMVMKMLLKDVDLKAADAELKPAGLGARDTLRLEAGMPLYGHELTEETDALSTGLDFAISLDKDQGEWAETFVGMDALRRIRESGGPARKLVGLAIEGKRTARQGMEVVSGSETVGVITSGCLSPTLGRAIAMGYVRAGNSGVGSVMQVGTGRPGAELTATVVPLPFYKAK